MPDARPGPVIAERNLSPRSSSPRPSRPVRPWAITASCRRFRLCSRPGRPLRTDRSITCAGAQCPAARIGARRFPRQGIDHQRASRPGGDDVRAGAGLGHQGQPRRVAGRRYRAQHRRYLPARVATDPRAHGHGHRTAQCRPRDGQSARAGRVADLRGPGALRCSLWCWASDRRRSRCDRRFPRRCRIWLRRRHDRLGKSVGPQLHDPVAAVPAQARPVQNDHDRPQDARAEHVRGHSAFARAGRHRSGQGGARAQMGGRADGGPLPANVVGRGAQPRQLQRKERAARGQGHSRWGARCRPAIDPDTGQPIYEEEQLDHQLPQIVVDRRRAGRI